MKAKHLVGMALLSAAVWSGSAGAAGWNPSAQSQSLEAAQATIAEFKATDSGLEEYFKKAYGWAVFPTIGKGGFIFAGSYGTGVVYQKGVAIGMTTVTQASFGLQIGGQTSSELIFFRDKAALDAFQAGSTEFSAQASAVIAREGAAAKTSYDNTGVAVFVHVKGGAMLEASIGGQKFSYQPGLGN
jgi:lipid-binding SYLF domain-containing protein